MRTTLLHTLMLGIALLTGHAAAQESPVDARETPPPSENTVFALGFFFLISVQCACIGESTSAKQSSSLGKYFCIKRFIE